METLNKIKTITIHLSNLKQLPENLRIKIRKIDPRATIVAQNNINRKHNYPVIEIPADGKRGISGGGWCMIFVYSKHYGNFIVQGYHRETTNFLRKNFTHYFYNITIFLNGGKRNFWHFWKENVGIFEPERKVSRYMKECGFKPTYKYSIRQYNRNFSEEEDEQYEKEKIELKRLPKRWIPEFDKI